MLCKHADWRYQRYWRRSYHKANSLIATACVSGILGGIVGHKIAMRMSEKSMRLLFGAALGVIVLICAINISSVFGAI